MGDCDRTLPRITLGPCRDRSRPQRPQRGWCGASCASRPQRPQRGWCGALCVRRAYDLPGQRALGPCHDRDARQGSTGEQPTVDDTPIEEQQRSGRHGGQDVRPGALVARRGLALIPERAGQARAHQGRQAEHPLAQAQVVVVRHLSQCQRMEQLPELGLICEPQHDVPREQPSPLADNPHDYKVER